MLLDFVNTFFLHRDSIYKKYTKDYEFIVSRYSNFNLNQFNYDDENNDFPDIYFIHLESINGDLKNKIIVPNFENYSNNYGVNFSNFYSNSTQTLLSEESILCALPPSINGYFQHKYNVQNLICLPKILNKFAYKTLFFKSHNLEFSQTGDFMLDMGFNEIHNQDIMSSQDVFYKWGFREDIFYKRVYEYINKYKDQKKFVYIAVSTTNHYPFIIYEKSNNLPIKNSNFISDRIKNTVYVQDKYLLDILEELKKDNREKYVFLFSDHSWPLNYHNGNILNQSRGYRENFYIPFAFLYFGDKENNFRIGNNVSNLYNQIDFLKSVLDLLNIKTGNNYLGNSFYCELLKDSRDCNINNCSISLQQYSDKYITFFLDNKHYIYNVKKKQAYYFDLLNDKYEKNQKNITQLEFLEFYEKCKNLIGY
ncbi:MAG: sulfatase-like hydrolase/transferase [Patescibacteria group bacterium]|nr:sulfatase-like hydrolase/transferase [Patescibacteria group bacterium]